MFYQCCKIISTFVRRICFKFDFGKLRIFFLQKITKSCLKPLFEFEKKKKNKNENYEQMMESLVQK